MRKLIIIGNGFDLSLGLKTRYEDFLHNLFFNTLQSSIHSNKKRINGSKLGYGSTQGDVSINGYSENNFLSIIIRTNYGYDTESLLKRFEKLEPFIDELNQSQQLKIEINNSILKETIENGWTNWVDIESTYFELLRNQLNRWLFAEEKTKFRTESKKQLLVDIRAEVQKLNSELSEISGKLKEYLKVDVLTQGLEGSVGEHFARFERFVLRRDGATQKPEIIHLLNFNYTHTIQNYCNHDSFQINPIHGILDEDIIFGYGDEMVKAYKEMEELNENCFFEHIKSFGYFRNDRYRQLLSFMGSGDFEVNIYGHSCGLSDRVLLSEIFQHEKCRFIRVYHRSIEDYINKTMEISRHFNSNELLRNRILPYNPEDFIPQVE